ncbi:uncharacterized protein STEHIDRAFT_143167 [Stereum hirsutum FP-91666 SS1]|uniref:CoA-dependent acyltransferase n=1 Tax=Stereum hirsutum (strain FP-91666) TaxID=721885 RepID=R7RXJ2_STEHR|nr:uncharacterized protein STEHIDRAFT_143167 [Stereum hirsutum FP-91666 SS1]EIM79595.1 hypothetical protein STEHIDRAFT_143167 [Stereum hirsutum FP-91666 SS1]
MAAPAFPPVDFSRYVWRTSPEDPMYYIREAAGGEVIEDVWNRFNHGEQTLFIGVDTTIDSSPSSSKLLDACRNAWVALRFTIPTIAAHTEQDAVGNTLITYRVANDSAEASSWAERTVRLHETTDDLDEIRYKIGKIHIPDENGDQTFLYVVPRSNSSVSFLLHTAHTPFDGAGAKALFSRFFRLLSTELDNSLASSNKALAWGSEGAKLTPVASEILGPNEQREGEGYQKTLGNVMSDLGSAMPRQYGFKKRNIGPGPTRRASTILTADESTKFREVARSLGFTVNHLAHAAVAIVCAHDNPPSSSTPEDATFVFYGLVDSRDRLNSEYSGKGSSAYTGYCLGMSAIQLPVSVVSSSASEGEKAQLLKAAEVIKQEYARQKAYPALLAIEAQQVEMMLSGLRAGGPPPPPWMGPWFAGDGIGETYLEPTYGSNIRVDDFFTSLNKTDPGPFFRLYSWGNRITLSADYNENAMPRDVVEGFIEKWASLLRLTL